MNNPGVGDFRAVKPQRFQLGQPFEMNYTGVSHVGTGKIQPGHLYQPFEMNHSSVTDLSLVERQPSQLSQSFEIGQSGICDLCAIEPQTLQLGQSYTIANDKFGDKSGELSLQVSGLTLPVRIDKWDAQQINFTVPSVGLDKPTDGMFHIAGADHTAAKAVPVTVLVAQELAQATK